MTTLARRRKIKTAYWLLIPGFAWLFFFFFFPLGSLFATSLKRPLGVSPEDGFAYALQFSNYSQAMAEYWPFYVRAFTFAAIATLFCLLLAYPISYYIAFKATRYKYLMLVLIIAPFFASFLLRTNAWKTILSSEGAVVGFLNLLGVLPEERILSTSLAVVLGLIYNFLPFMILPLFLSLDKIDKRLLEAAGDLYATGFQRFWRVVWPLSIPGVVSGTILTFIPASGDYINAELLGGISDKMIGNVIQSQFIILRNYPQASALSFTLMAIILVFLYLYLRKVGTKELL